MTALTPAANLDPAEFPDPAPLAPLAVGDVVHFYAALSFAVNDRFGSTAHLTQYGSEYVCTAEMLAANPPEQAGSVWGILDDPDAQVQRYGRVVVARGPWPEHEPRTEAGTPERALQLKDAERRAWQQNGHPADALAEIALVRAILGQPEPTSRTLSTGPAR